MYFNNFSKQIFGGYHRIILMESSLFLFQTSASRKLLPIYSLFQPWVFCSIWWDIKVWAKLKNLQRVYAAHQVNESDFYTIFLWLGWSCTNSTHEPYWHSDNVFLTNSCVLKELFLTSYQLIRVFPSLVWFIFFIFFFFRHRKNIVIFTCTGSMSILNQVCHSLPWISYFTLDTYILIFNYLNLVIPTCDGKLVLSLDPKDC